MNIPTVCYLCPWCDHGTRRIGRYTDVSLSSQRKRPSSFFAPRCIKAFRVIPLANIRSAAKHGAPINNNNIGLLDNRQPSRSWLLCYLSRSSDPLIDIGFVKFRGSSFPIQRRVPASTHRGTVSLCCRAAERAMPDGLSTPLPAEENCKKVAVG